MAFVSSVTVNYSLGRHSNTCDKNVCLLTSSPSSSSSSSSSSFITTTTKFEPRQPHNPSLHIVHTVINATTPSTSPSPASTSTPTTPPNILISGAPASGKGTQCELLVSHYNLVHISTGDMLRSAVSSKTPLGLEAKSYMDAGDLVPDELVISLLRARLQSSDVEKSGWLLDGFPRTAVQAEALDESGIIPDSVLVLEVPDQVLIDRVVGRRLDPKTGKVYHVKYNRPQDKEIESRLIKRSDDTEEKAKNRLRNYSTHSQSIFDHYGTSKVVRVDGNRDKQTVFQNLIHFIDNGPPPKQDDDDTSGGQIQDEDNSTTDTPITEGSTKGLSVSEFVKKAEEAYEIGVLQTKDVQWSGQAALDDGTSSGTSSYTDIVKRPDLVIGDTLSILLFAYIGRSTHGHRAVDIEVLKTSMPFLAAWFLTTPLLGLYTRKATMNVKLTLQHFVKGWAVAIPMGVGLRGVVTEHVPPMAFTVITLVSTFFIIGGWRLAYVKAKGDESEEGLRGGLFDGLRMVTTLLNRW